MTRKTAVLWAVFTAAAFAGGGALYQAWRDPCVSREPGLRGETMRTPDGKVVYHNGQCWTREAMPPRDTPF